MLSRRTSRQRRKHRRRRSGPSVRPRRHERDRGVEEEDRFERTSSAVPGKAEARATKGFLSPRPGSCRPVLISRRRDAIGLTSLVVFGSWATELDGRTLIADRSVLPCIPSERRGYLWSCSSRQSFAVFHRKVCRQRRRHCGGRKSRRPQDDNSRRRCRNARHRAVSVTSR